MNDKTIRLASGGASAEAGWSRLTWRVAGLDPEDFILSHAVPEPDSNFLSDPQRGDHALCAVLLKAMEQRRDIVIEGKVSPKLLDGVETLQAIWHRWRPKRYYPIRVRADEESEATPILGERSAVFAFSGGVDASFSLFRHLQGHAGRNNRRPGTALLVHGMDIPLHRDDFYDNAAARAERMLDGTGVPLLRMRTNSRQLRQDWEDSFGLQFTACFLLLQATHAHAVRGSGEPYESFVLPWGSTPLTDPLGSTASMAVIHDGCDADRTEKVSWLATNTQAVDHLRVCWEGPNRDRNCGECEKCVRTMLDFWAMQLPIPAAFPTQLTPERVASIRIRNRIQQRCLIRLLQLAEERHPKGDPILKALTRRLGNTGPRALAREAVRLIRVARGRTVQP